MNNIHTDIIEADVNQDLVELELIEIKIKTLLRDTSFNIKAKPLCGAEKQRMRSEEKELRNILHLIYQKKERVYNIINR